MQPVLFASLHEKLIARVRYRIRSGEMTERGFAKVTGLSQPHLHNVLKGARSLSTHSADLIFKHLGISISELLDPGFSQEHGQSLTTDFALTAPHLGGAAGPFQRLEPESLQNLFYPIPKLNGISMENPAWVTLAYDPDVFPYFQDQDLALVDRTSESLVVLENNSVYLVETQNGTLVRTLRLAGNRLHLITPKNALEPRQWTPLPLDGRNPGEVIFGKLILLQRQLRQDNFGVASRQP